MTESVDRFSAKREQSVAECSNPQTESQDRIDRRPGLRSNDSYDGSEPLTHLGHEATAQYMSNLKPEREFKTIRELANHSGVTSQTIHRWKKDSDVLKRVRHLTAYRRLQGDLIPRLCWPRIMQRLTRRAEEEGDLAIVKYLESQAWREETQLEKPEMSIGEMFRRTIEEEVEVPRGLPMVGEWRLDSGDSKPE